METLHVKKEGEKRKDKIWPRFEKCYAFIIRLLHEAFYNALTSRFHDTRVIIIFLLFR